jgi:DNA-binding transcriptional MerR regulator
MFTIGEFARLGSVSARMLRHYDAIGLLIPAAVDPETGYRRYEFGQIPDLNRILAFRAMGFSLAETKSLLSGVGAEELRLMLLRQASQLREEVDGAKPVSDSLKGA